MEFPLPVSVVRALVLSRICTHTLRMLQNQIEAQVMNLLSTMFYTLTLTLCHCVCTFLPKSNRSDVKR